MGVVKFRLATFLERSNFSGNFEQRVDRASGGWKVFGKIRAGTLFRSLRVVQLTLHNLGRFYPVFDAFRAELPSPITFHLQFIKVTLNIRIS